MKEQMNDYWKAWKEYGDDWRAIFEALDPLIYAFAKRHKMEVLPWPWDEPSRVLSWESDGLQRSIRLIIHGHGSPGSYEIRVYGSCWRDDVENNERVRYYHHHPEEASITIGRAAMAGEKQGEFRDLLDRTFGAVSSWTTDVLTEKAFLGKVSQIL